MARLTHRLYYDDPMLRNFKARVLSCEPIAPESSSGLPAPVWAVTLDSTAFYPTSGGQPHDTGKLGAARVLDVRDEGEEIVHITDAPVAPGAVEGCIDWERRFDHMQQHTGQHLLSAMFQERFGLPTVSFHLGSESSTIDLCGTEPSDLVVEGAERAANQVVFEDRPIIVRYATPEQLAEMGVRKAVERQGILRVIEIEGADLQPCGGTHVKSTGQIGTILVRRPVKMRQDWRLEFRCGDRAARAARADRKLLREAAERLKCATEEIAGAAERLVLEKDCQFKSLREMAGRLARAEAQGALSRVYAGPDGNRVVAILAEGVEPDYLLALATELAKEQGAIALCGHPAGDLVFAQHPSAKRNMKELLLRVFESLEGKGGGTADFARGRLADGAKARAAVDLAGSLLLAARAAD